MTSILDNMQSISIAKINDRKDKLREVRDKDYLRRLMRTINDNTLYQPITVIADPETPGEYILSDGAHRLMACKELGWDEIPAFVLDINISDLNFQQIIANDVRKTTSKLEYAKALQRILATDEYSGLTQRELLDKLGIDKSPTWLDNQLKINNVLPELQREIEEGKISFSNGSWLGRLPSEFQLEFADQARNEAPNDFVTTVSAKLKELSNAKKGRSNESTDPLAHVKLRKKTELKGKFAELESQIKANPDNQYLSGYLEGVAYAMSVDAETRKKEEAEKAAKEAMKQQFAADRKALLERQKKIAEEQAAKLVAASN